MERVMHVVMGKSFKSCAAKMELIELNSFSGSRPPRLS